MVEGGKRINVDNVSDLAGGMQLTRKDTIGAVPFKVCIVGNANVGKTCIVDRYVNDNFSFNSPPTLAADFFTKVVTATPPGYPSMRVKL